jgi:hypothetical protein
MGLQLNSIRKLIIEEGDKKKKNEEGEKKIFKI